MPLQVLKRLETDKQKAKDVADLIKQEAKREMEIKKQEKQAAREAAGAHATLPARDGAD